MKKGPPLIVSLVLALVGIGALAAAVLLVPPMVRQFAALEIAKECAAMKQHGGGSSANPPGTSVQKPAKSVDVPGAVPGAGSPQKATEPAVQAAPSTEPAGEDKGAREGEKPGQEELPEEKPTTGTQGPWNITLDDSSYEIVPEHKGAIDEIIASLNAKENAVVEVTGVNHPNKSSKRAKKAASVVKDQIVADVGIKSWRVKTKASQEPEVDGVQVRVVLKGGE